MKVEKKLDRYVQAVGTHKLLIFYLKDLVNECHLFVNTNQQRHGQIPFYSATYWENRIRSISTFLASPTASIKWNNKDPIRPRSRIRRDVFMKGTPLWQYTLASKMQHVTQCSRDRKCVQNTQMPPGMVTNKQAICKESAPFLPSCGKSPLITSHNLALLFVINDLKPTFLKENNWPQRTNIFSPGYSLRVDINANLWLSFSVIMVALQLLRPIRAYLSLKMKAKESLLLVRANPQTSVCIETSHRTDRLRSTFKSH